MPLTNNFRFTTSWDDGHPLDLRIAEYLAKYGIRGTFYVPMRNSLPTLSPPQIRELSSHFEIGAHTVNHVILTRCSRDQAWREIRESKERIEEITGNHCATLCFPSGRYNRGHVRMAAAAGFSAVRTVEFFSLDLPYRVNGMSVIPTTLQASPQPRYVHLRNAVKRMRGKALWNLTRFSRGKDWGATAKNITEHLCNRGGVFHLWGHSWEIEEQGQWSAFESVLRNLVACGQSLVPVTNSELCALT
jgi:peptidoglycan-N-acetylglucosamine deacetylase